MAKIRVPLILIVDDDATTISMITVVLVGAGFNTRSARTIAEALAIIDDRRPDLILLDVQLPDGTGFEVCRNLNSRFGASSIPVLFISASDDVSTKLNGFKAGAVDYITKPVTGAEVLARVSTHLRLRQTYESLVELQAERIQRLAGAQKAVMPLPADIPEAHFQISLKQVLRAGGDFYDVIPVGDQIFDYLVADASGHDLAASFWIAALKALVTEYAIPSNTPRQALNAINGTLIRVLPQGTYFTLAYARLNRRKERVTVISAGHPPIIIIPRDNQDIIVAQLEGDVLGAFSDAFFDVIELPARAGDRILLYSDGLVDGFSQEGAGALAAACRTARTAPLKEMIRSIFADLTAKKAADDDDIVLMGVEV
jgi:phosphoserine phosphatase RsbU/P